MPESLVNRLGRKNELSEFRTVLHDAGDRVMRSVDAEAMARELLESGSREVVELVRDLTTALARVEKDLEGANRRNERLCAELARRGIRMTPEDVLRQESDESDGRATEKLAKREVEQAADAVSEWEEWDRRFQSLLA